MCFGASGHQGAFSILHTVTQEKKKQLFSMFHVTFHRLSGVHCFIALLYYYIHDISRDV